jgi:hypothetical protein
MRHGLSKLLEWCAPYCAHDNALRPCFATLAATSICDRMWKVRLQGAGAHADRHKLVSAAPAHAHIQKNPQNFYTTVSTTQYPLFLCCTVPAALFQ